MGSPGTALGSALAGAGEAQLAISRADDALVRLAAAQDAMEDPLLVVALDRQRLKGVRVDVRELPAAMCRRQIAYGRRNPLRYRWGLSHGAQPGSASYALNAGAFPVHWRPAEAERLASQPSAYGQRLMEPITLAAYFGYLGRLMAERPGEATVSGTAAALLVEATPMAEHDIAGWHNAVDPWRDTFGLWLLTAEPESMARLRDLLFGLALRYAAITQRDGLVRGISHPFYGRPLVSASAQLASGLWRFGIYPSLIPDLMSFVALMREADGGWADEGQPADVLTTLAAADLLVRLDPGFDPRPTIDWFVRHQETGGWWRALNPEVPWLTRAIIDWLELAQRPFCTRFEWPSAPIWSRDRLSGLATIATLEELERALAGLARVRDEVVSAAFVDLAGFGIWNGAHGQVRGDAVIGLVGTTLEELGESLAVRLGGDEFLVLDKPGAPPDRLAAVLDGWRQAWPRRLAAIGATGVAPRIVLGSATADDLRELRMILGEAIARAKQAAPSPPADGAMFRIADRASGDVQLEEIGFARAPVVGF